MKHGKLKRMSNTILLALTLVLWLGIAACGDSTPSATPAGSPTPGSVATPTPIATITPEVTPTPTPTTAPTPIPTPIATPTPTPTATPSPTATATPTPAPTPTPTPTPGPAEITVTSNRAIADFPNTIAFTLDGSSSLPVAKIELEYGTSKRSIISEVGRVEPEYAPGATIRASWIWQMKKTGSLPPGAEVWWRWRITDEADRKYVTPRQAIVFEDTHYLWQVVIAQNMDIYWHSLGTGLTEELTAGAESKLLRVKLEVHIPEERKPKVFVYADAEEVRSAVLFTQEWTGALAFFDYNIILLPMGPDDMEWGKRTLAHEITHLLVREATFGPFGDIPTWLNEGLATYAEGDLMPYEQEALDQAIADNELLSVRSLGSGFPADPSRALLAYAESHSLVSYLIDTHGWAKMRELLSVFKEGSTYDNALQSVYSFDTDGLEERWRAHIGTS